MGISFEDFNKLHVSLKSFVVGVVLLTPFWYLDLYLFKKGFVSVNYIQVIPGIMAFCLSLTWLAAMAISTFSFLNVVQNEKKLTDFNSVYSITTVVLSVLHLAIYTGIGYYCKLNFIEFTKQLYIFLFCRILLWRWGLYVLKKYKPKT